jgi:two-component system, OmpR family, response regulator MprA
MDTTLLVAEDDRQVREALERILRFEGYSVVSVADGAAALEAIDAVHPDAIVLDVTMPFVDGLSVCRRLRARNDRTPVLMLTARSDVRDRVSGLDAGADDYLQKPFALDELLARLRALLRRTEHEATCDPVHRTLTFGNLKLDLGGRLVRQGSRGISLTRTEFRILEMLMRHPEVVLDRAVMYTEIWGYDGTSSKALDVHTRYVRRKLEAGGEPRVIHTIHSVGYVLRATLDGDP